MEISRPREPGFGSGGATFSRLPLVLDPEGLSEADVAILGAPIDETVSYRPGARFGPRAIRQADVSGGSPPSFPHMELGVDPVEELTVVDHGDIEAVPGNPVRSHEILRQTVRRVLEAGCVPVVLGGDHSILHPDAGAMADHLGQGRVGVIHFDAHADDADEIWGVRYSHGTPVRRLVEEGAVRGDMILQVGLRGPWPGREEFDWAREQGLVWHTMGEIEERGLGSVLDEVAQTARDWEHVYLSLDIDVVDPGSAPGTGTPEPGGLSPREFLIAIRRLAVEVGFDGLEVVEVSPPYDHADVTALLAHRTVVEALSGLALRRSAREPKPERPTR